MPAPADALAAISDASWGRRSRAYQPTRLRLDSGLWLDLPSPRHVAEVYSLPSLTERQEVYRGASGVLARPHGASEPPTPLDARSLVEADLAALTDRDDARRPYRDLRLFLEHAEPATRDAYLDAVTAALRTLAPRPPRPPRVPSTDEPASAPLTPQERRARHATRTRTAEEQSARLVLAALVGARPPFDSPVADDLADYLPEASEPGERLDLQAAHEAAVEAMSDLGGDTVDECGNVARAPGRSTFYAVARAMLGPDRRPAGGGRYVVTPDPATLHRAPAVDEHLAAIRAPFDAAVAAALDNGQRGRALRLQRERLRLEADASATVAAAIAAIAATR